MRTATVERHPSPLHRVTQVPDGFLTHGILVPFEDVWSPDGEPCPARYLPRLLILLDEYGAICTAANAVFPIASAYRSLDYQQHVMRSSKDEHTTARALDMFPLPGWTPGRMSLYAMARRREQGSKLGSIGIAPGWLHVSIAPTSRRALYRWKTNDAAD